MLRGLLKFDQTPERTEKWVETMSSPFGVCYEDEGNDGLHGYDLWLLILRSRDLNGWEQLELKITKI